jgi:hypothetical protein
MKLDTHAAMRIARAAIAADDADLALWALEQQGAWHSDRLRPQAREAALRVQLARSALADAIASLREPQ